jgi:hypothetical protein
VLLSPSFLHLSELFVYMVAEDCEWKLLVLRVRKPQHHWPPIFVLSFRQVFFELLSSLALPPIWISSNVKDWFREDESIMCKS